MAIQFKEADFGWQVLLDGKTVLTIPVPEGCHDSFELINDKAFYWRRKTDKPVTQPVLNAYYAGVDSIKPIQEFIDADEEDWTAGVYDTVKTAFSDREGKLIGWPLGVSSAGWFVNVDMLKQAGYAPEDLTSYVKVTEAATAIASKKIADYGIAYYYTGMDLYDGITLQGCDFLDNENGHKADATKSVITEGETNKVLKEFLSKTGALYENGYAYTYQANIDSDITPAFVDGKIGIIGATNSYAHKLIHLAPSFDWQFIPNTVITEGGAYQGYALCEGTGTYIVNNGNEKIMQGAYEMIKFLSTVENQSYWCSNTGYIPYTDEAFADADYQSWMTENLPEAATMQQTLKSIPAELRGPYGTMMKMESNQCQKQRLIRPLLRLQNGFRIMCLA